LEKHKINLPNLAMIKRNTTIEDFIKHHKKGLNASRSVINTDLIVLNEVDELKDQ